MQRAQLEAQVKLVHDVTGRSINEIRTDLEYTRDAQTTIVRIMEGDFLKGTLREGRGEGERESNNGRVERPPEQPQQRRLLDELLQPLPPPARVEGECRGKGRKGKERGQCQSEERDQDWMQLSSQDLDRVPNQTQKTQNHERGRDHNTGGPSTQRASRSPVKRNPQIQVIDLCDSDDEMPLAPPLPPPSPPHPQSPPLQPQPIQVPPAPIIQAPPTPYPVPFPAPFPVPAARLPESLAPPHRRPAPRGWTIVPAEALNGADMGWRASTDILPPDPIIQRPVERPAPIQRQPAESPGTPTQPPAPIGSVTPARPMERGSDNRPEAHTPGFPSLAPRAEQVGWGQINASGMSGNDRFVPSTLHDGQSVAPVASGTPVDRGRLGSAPERTPQTSGQFASDTPHAEQSVPGPRRRRNNLPGVNDRFAPSSAQQAHVQQSASPPQQAQTQPYTTDSWPSVNPPQAPAPAQTQAPVDVDERRYTWVTPWTAVNSPALATPTPAQRARPVERPQLVPIVPTAPARWSVSTPGPTPDTRVASSVPVERTGHRASVHGPMTPVERPPMQRPLLTPNPSAPEWSTVEKLRTRTSVPTPSAPIKRPLPYHSDLGGPIAHNTTSAPPPANRWSTNTPSRPAPANRASKQLSAHQTEAGSVAGPSTAPPVGNRQQLSPPPLQPVFRPQSPALFRYQSESPSPMTSPERRPTVPVRLPAALESPPALLEPPQPVMTAPGAQAVAQKVVPEAKTPKPKSKNEIKMDTVNLDLDIIAIDSGSDSDGPFMSAPSTGAGPRRKRKCSGQGLSAATRSLLKDFEEGLESEYEDPELVGAGAGGRKRRRPAGKRATGKRKGKKAAEDKKPAVLSDGESDDTLAQLPRKSNRLTDAEKAARAAEKEAAKAARQAARDAKALEREEARAQKIREKEAQKAAKSADAELALANKLRSSWKDTVREMVVDMSPGLTDDAVGQSLRRFLGGMGCEAGAGVGWGPGGVLLNGEEGGKWRVVKWRRKVTALWDEGCGLFVPLPGGEVRVLDESLILVHLTATEFQDVLKSDGGLAAHVEKAKRFLPVEGKKVRVMYVLEGMEALLRQIRNRRNRAYQSRVRAALGEGEVDVGREVEERTEEEEEIQGGLMQVQVVLGCLVHQTVSGIESAEWMARFTGDVSTVPYKNSRITPDVRFCADLGQVRIGVGKTDIYLRMLEQINRVTPGVAMGIQSVYPDVQSLVRAFEENGEDAIAEVPNVMVRGGMERCVGPHTSKRVCNVFGEWDEGSVEI